MMQQLEQLKRWHDSLPPRDMWLVNLMAILLLTTLFYVSVWEPLHKELAEAQVKHETQQKLLQWMQRSAQEVEQLRGSGNTHRIKQRNTPTMLVLEQSLSNGGLKLFLRKIESTDNNRARVNLDNVPFNQMLVWLNTIATHNGIIVSSATIERGEKPGSVNAKLHFTRP